MYGAFEHHNSVQQFIIIIIFITYKALITMMLKGAIHRFQLKFQLKTSYLLSIDDFWKRYDFSICLKCSRESHFLNARGSLLKSLGAAAAKALSPYVIRQVLGSTSLYWSFIRSSRLFLHLTIKSCIYTGAIPCNALYVINDILYSILSAIGSQCKSRSTGVIWSYFPVDVTWVCSLTYQT